MLKKIIASLVVTLGLTNLSFAASEGPIFISVKFVCVDDMTLAKTLGKYGEEPMMTMTTFRDIDGKGTFVENTTVLFLNLKTKSWTLVEQIHNNLYCIPSLGDNIKPYLDKTENKP